MFPSHAAAGVGGLVGQADFADRFADGPSSLSSLVHGRLDATWDFLFTVGSDKAGALVF